MFNLANAAKNHNRSTTNRTIHVYRFPFFRYYVWRTEINSHNEQITTIDYETWDRNDALVALRILRRRGDLNAKITIEKFIDTETDTPF